MSADKKMNIPNMVYLPCRLCYIYLTMALSILSPLSAPDEVERLIKAGADEFYCGILPKQWRQDYSVAASLNRRQEDNLKQDVSPHMTTFEELTRCVELAKPHNVTIAITLNEHFYSNNQYPFLTNYIEQCLKSGADTFIVGDIGMILTLQDIDPDVNIHISTAGTAFNAESVHFYRDLGAKRVILPRHLTLDEIQAIVDKVNGIELEAFILNSRCANIDGFCTFQHGLVEFNNDPERKRDFENACMMIYKITADVKGCDSPEQAESMLEKVSWERQHFWSAVHIDDRPCGACALYEFENMGLAGVKIVGRANTFEKKIKDIRFLKGLLDFLRTKKPTKKEFRKQAQTTYKDLYDCLCLIFKCYYPSVMLDDDN